MNLNEAFTLFQTQVSNMDSLWAYYSTITIAILGFTIASDKATRSRNEILVIQVGYLLFAIGNALAIASSQRTLIQLGKLVKQAGGPESLVNAFQTWEVMIFHITVTVFVLIIIDVTYRYNKKMQLSSSVGS